MPLPPKYHYMVIARGRQMFQWWPERKLAKKRAQIADHVYMCEGCFLVVVTDEETYLNNYEGVQLENDTQAVLDRVEVDHILPVIAIGDGWAGYDVYYERLFCNATNLQVLCSMCHKIKTFIENDERRNNKENL